MDSNTALHNLNQEPLEGVHVGKRCDVGKGEGDAIVSVWFARPVPKLLLEFDLHGAALGRGVHSIR